MASSSSAKKVARVAARSGGGAKAGKQAAWIFPVAIGLIVVLGIGVVVYARAENAGGNDNSTPPRAQLVEGEPFDHWHAAFAVNVCGKEQPPPNDVEADLLGIHTHGDGLIHIHPFATRASGRNATLKRFFDQVGLEVTDDGFETADGKVFKEGETTCGGEPAKLILAHWEDARTAGSAKPDQVYTENFPSVRLSEDLGAYTLAFEVEGDEDVPAPSASAQIEELGAADGGTTQSNAPESEDPSASVPETSAPAEGTPEGTPEGSAPGGDTTAEDTAPATTTPTTAAAGG